jgi:hypothetical protein
MKLMFVAASLAVAVACAPSLAQAQDTATDSGVYVNLGYARASQGGIHLDAIDARLGYRINKYVGVEGEGAFGIGGDDVRVGTASAHVKLSHEFAAYAVGFLPVAENADLFARIGYGTTKIKASALGAGASGSDESVNFGVGGQYHFDGVNGVRVEYTRFEYNDGGHANLWGIAYAAKF